MIFPGEPAVSIIIPTLNAASELPALLEAIAGQSLHPLEIIIVDSESDDGTAEIAASFSSTKLPVWVIRIKKADFGHGRTRNLAAEAAAGSILVFLTQDALPASSNWLENLVAPFSEDDVACVFGRHVPRQGGNPVIASDINRHFSEFGSSGLTRQRVDWNTRESVEDYARREGWFTFFSNVNSAIRKEVWKVIPFRDVGYSEDCLFGKDVILAGMVKAYAAEAAVYHSHEYTLSQFFRRYFDEYRGLKATLNVTDGVSLLTLLPVAALCSLRDMRFIIFSDVRRKIYWCFYTPWYHIVRRVGAYLGGRYRVLPRALRKMLSLEGRG